MLAIGYAWWDFTSSPEPSRTASAFVKSLGVAFFLIMWFVGQWFRADKQLTDAEQLSGIQADVQEIKEAIRERMHASVSNARQAPVVDPVARTLLAEAEAAMDAGLNRSALVMAAVTLEHALRRFAERSKIPEASRLPIPKVLSQLRRVIGPALADDLYGLWRARNVIVHGENGELVDSSSANRLYDSFRWAISYLSEERTDA